MKKLTFLTALMLLLASSVFFVTSCDKSNNKIDIATVTSKDYSKKDWKEITQLITNKIEFENYLKQMYDNNHVKINFTNNEILKLGNPMTNTNLLAAMAVSEDFDFKDILWTENSVEDESVEKACGKEYRKRVGTKFYFSVYCTGYAVDADVWCDYFRGGCNPSYYVKKERKRVCPGSINCY